MLVKRKMSLTELSEKVGVTLANLSVLKRQHAKAIRFSTLAGICKALECQPGDILEFVDEPETSTQENQKIFQNSNTKTNSLESTSHHSPAVRLSHRWISPVTSESRKPYA